MKLRKGFRLYPQSSFFYEEILVILLAVLLALAFASCKEPEFYYKEFNIKGQWRGVLQSPDPDADEVQEGDVFMFFESEDTMVMISAPVSDRDSWINDEADPPSLTWNEPIDAYTYSYSMDTTEGPIRTLTLTSSEETGLSCKVIIKDNDTIQVEIPGPYLPCTMTRQKKHYEIILPTTPTP